MAQTPHRHTDAVNLREEAGRNTPSLYMPAMPPLGLSRTISQWLRGRLRQRQGASLKGLNGHLQNDLGYNPNREQRLTERQLTVFYAQPLGRSTSRAGSGMPAEYHATRRRIGN